MVLRHKACYVAMPVASLRTHSALMKYGNVGRYLFAL